MKKDAEAKIYKPVGVSVGDTVLVHQDGLVTKQLMLYWVEPHEVIAKKGNMITTASTNLWLGISHYSNGLMIWSNNLAVTSCLMNSRMQTLKKCLYQIHSLHDSMW